MPGKFDNLVMYAVNLVIFSIVVLKKVDNICPRNTLKTIAVNSGGNIKGCKPCHHEKKKDKTTTTTNHKKYQLFLLNNTNHWGFTVRKIFGSCLILHCSKQQQAAKVKQCD